jgi:hypothetical protein
MEISLDAWQRRPLTEKLIAFIGIVLERQQ